MWDIICPSISFKDLAIPFLLCMEMLGTEAEAIRTKKERWTSTSQEKGTLTSEDAKSKCVQRGGQAFISIGKTVGGLPTQALRKFRSIREN